MTSLCLVSTRHVMFNRRMVARENGQWVCYRASAYAHSFHEKAHSRGCSLYAAAKWLVWGSK